MVKLVGPEPELRSRLIYGLICLSVIMIGLASRCGFARSHHIPKDVGDVLYAALAFFLLAFAFPRASTLRSAGYAFLFCVAIEAFKLVHSPWIEPIRDSLPARLILGHDFSAMDIADYAVGILIAGACDLGLNVKRRT